MHIGCLGSEKMQKTIVEFSISLNLQKPLSRTCVGRFEGVERIS